MRIAVMGYSGSGKSTLAKYLSAYYDIPVLFLDTVQFEADWRVREGREAVSIVQEFMEHDQWIIDGNYSSFLQAERLQAADQIVLLQFNRFNCLFRVIRRYFRYKNTVRESMAQGCNEKIDLEFIQWILYAGRNRDKKKGYEEILLKYPQKTKILKNQKQLENFMLMK